jgi:hypothetical protein
MARHRPRNRICRRDPRTTAFSTLLTSRLKLAFAEMQAERTATGRADASVRSGRPLQSRLSPPHQHRPGEPIRGTGWDDPFSVTANSLLGCGRSQGLPSDP